MPRLPRPTDDDLVFHAINRGNNRQRVFDCDDDYAFFLDALRRTRQRYPFDLFAYCLMPNHFHLLLRPHPGRTISRIMQSLTVTHTWHFHRAGQSSGHVWQGRFKSPVIQSDEHLLWVMRYIEANPWRAGMVADLADWRWSSFPSHAGLLADDLVSDCFVWNELGKSAAERCKYWRGWLHTPQTEKELAALRRSVSSGRPYGDEAWTAQMSQRLGLAATPRRRGRPRKEKI